MLLAHKLELYPTSKQSVEIVKDYRAKFEWLQDVSTRVIRNTVDDIDEAIKKG